MVKRSAAVTSYIVHVSKDMGNSEWSTLPCIKKQDNLEDSNTVPVIGEGKQLGMFKKYLSMIDCF